MVQIHQDSHFFMNTFRFKIFVSYLILLVLFLSLMFPFVTNSVERIVIQSMNERAAALIATLDEAKDEKTLIQAVKDTAYLVFFHVSLINDQMQLLFDSHSKRIYSAHVILPDKLPVDVQKALTEGDGFSEQYSALVGQKLVYLAKSFDFHGKKYIIRLAFPCEYIQQLKKKFETGFLLLCSIILILFSVMTGVIIYLFMGPVRQIIRAIMPYQAGKSPFIAEIHIRSYLQDEFSELAKTFNALSSHIKHQVDTLTHERNEKEVILESLAEGVLAVDQQMHISYANSMALHFLGCDRTIIGQLFPITCHPKCFELLHQCQKKNELLNDEISITQSGKQLHLNIVVSPRKHEREGGAILVLQDKSIHYKILEMRKEFIANASHELKTPITIIRGFAETLRDNPHLDHKTVADITEKLVRNSQRMNKIIKNLLTLADIENLPRFRLQYCNMIDLILHCKQTLLSIYPKADVQIRYSSTLPKVEIDAELIEVALMNLIDNAIKYSKQEATVIVTVEEKPEAVTIAIQDQGIGIPEADLEHIFNRFYTVNKAESKKLGGSGLGLAIVETIVEKHFGKISVTSMVGSGSIFTIELPIEAVGAAAIHD